MKFVLDYVIVVKYYVYLNCYYFVYIVCVLVRLDWFLEFNEYLIRFFFFIRILWWWGLLDDIFLNGYKKVCNSMVKYLYE